MKNWILRHLSILLLFIGSLISLPMAGQVDFDSIFIRNARPVIFQVNRDKLRPQDERWIADTLRRQLESIGPDGIIICRSAASPEGPYYNNVRLAKARREAMLRVLKRHGYDTSRLQFNVIPEDYELLATMMRLHNDPDLIAVQTIIERHGLENPQKIKQALQFYQHGKLWKRLLRQYFPRLRGVRVMAVDGKRLEANELPGDTLKPIIPTLPQMVLDTLDVNLPLSSHRQMMAATDSMQLMPEHRIPLLNVRTNMAYDVFYMPQFGWAPMWNVGLEYYPRSGHFTYGAWYLNPFYQHWNQHKFFQIRNYELEVRYYFRGAHDNADYRGFYVSAAVDANKYAIGLGKRKGWEGEGFGAQLTAGYVIGLARHNQWKLHLTAGVGIYQTRYDPYLFDVPDYFGHEEDGKYYYDTNLYRDEFSRRQHRYRWMGPTQLGISISYDILWRRKSSGVSFRRWEHK